jgi:hypothetical protein
MSMCALWRMCNVYKHRLLRICADYLYPEELILLLLATGSFTVAGNVG